MVYLCLSNIGVALTGGLSLCVQYWRVVSKLAIEADAFFVLLIVSVARVRTHTHRANMDTSGFIWRLTLSNLRSARAIRIRSEQFPWGKCFSRHSERAPENCASPGRSVVGLCAPVGQDDMWLIRKLAFGNPIMCRWDNQESWFYRQQRCFHFKSN